ncbi:MAG: hypothetical protein JW987_12560 [Anaerolineaceae bacterium]|nr:hypothetical protein [Anaerolineaceae bacterium]
MPTLDEFFVDFSDSRPLFDELRRVIDENCPSEMIVSKSQVAFRRKKAFAWAWVPGRYLLGKVAPLVLSVSMPQRDASPRWKEVVQPAPGRFMHHLELYKLEDLDEQVIEWLRSAWNWAG